MANNTHNFEIKLTIIPIPILIWDLKLREYFVITETGWDEKDQCYKVYQKLSQLKALVVSKPNLDLVSIPLLFPLGSSAIGFRVVSEWYKYTL